MAVAMWWMGSGWDGIGCISHFHTFTFISARRNTLSGRQPSNFQILSLSLSQVHFLSFTFNFTLSLSYRRDATPSLAGNLPIFKSFHFPFLRFTFSVLLSISHFHFHISETQHTLWRATFQSDFQIHSLSL